VVGQYGAADVFGKRRRFPRFAVEPDPAGYCWLICRPERMFCYRPVGGLLGPQRLLFGCDFRCPVCGLCRDRCVGGVWMPRPPKHFGCSGRSVRRNSGAAPPGVSAAVCRCG